MSWALFFICLYCFVFSLGKAQDKIQVIPPGMTTQFHFMVSYLGDDQSFNVPERANLRIISYVPFINRVHFDVLFIA